MSNRVVDRMTLLLLHQFFLFENPERKIDCIAYLGYNRTIR